MKKLQLILRSQLAQPKPSLENMIRQTYVPRLLELSPRGMKLTWSDPKPPRMAVFPFRRQSLALVSLWFDGPLPGPEQLSGIFTDFPGGLSGYEVSESAPVTYEQQWPLGETTPGVGLLTLLKRKPGLDDQTFLERWHGGHSTLSLKIHPLWNYIRNVVQSRAVAGSPWWDGIVEEHFRKAKDLLDPRVFYGGALNMMPNMVRVAVDISGFIDLWSLETYLVKESYLPV